MLPLSHTVIQTQPITLARKNGTDRHTDMDRHQTDAHNFPLHVASMGQYIHCNRPKCKNSQTHKNKLRKMLHLIASVMSGITAFEPLSILMITLALASASCRAINCDCSILPC